MADALAGLSTESLGTAGAMLAVYAPAIFFDAIVQKTSLGLFLMSGTLLLLVVFQERRRLGFVLGAGLVLGLLAILSVMMRGS